MREHGVREFPYCRSASTSVSSEVFNFMGDECGFGYDIGIENFKLLAWALYIE